MKYLKKFEKWNIKPDDILIIVDVQKSFKKFFTEKYIHELKKYCEKFNRVYQIWDNHHLGKNVDKDYLYDEDPEIPVHKDLYHFPNQKDLIEKRYNYDVNADFFKPVLDTDVYEDVKKKEDKNELVKGDSFPTKEGTMIIYIGNNHKWYHLPKKLYDLFIQITEAQSVNENLGEVRDVILVGGADRECLEDVEEAARVMGVKLKRNEKFIYSATFCPIK